MFHKYANQVIRASAALVLAVALSGCIIAPYPAYGDYRPHPHYYW